MLASRFTLLAAWLSLAATSCGGGGQATVRVSSAAASSPSASAPQAATPSPAPIPVQPKPSPPASAYPPRTIAQARQLGSSGDRSLVHEFHSESVGLATCPQPKREVLVSASLTGQPLAAALLAYFFEQHLDNDCGSVVFAYHNEAEASDAYTAGRVIFSINDSNPKHQLEVNPGTDGTFDFSVAY
jgi:hypothetical protein